MKEIILAYQGEMTLKGLNRSKFEARLAKSIRYRLEDLGKFKVTQAQSTVFIEPLEDDLDMDEAFRRISKIFGIVKMSRAACCSKDFDEICATAEAYLGETLRGIRTFETSMRNTLDLAGVVMLHKMTHLPVVVDPSHACGHAWMVPQLAKAAVAAGADGLMIEVHNDPAKAKCDGAQSLTPDQFDELMGFIRKEVEFFGKKMN